MRILNLYACLGGNRFKWDEVAQSAGIDIEVTAIELDEELARLYQERFISVVNRLALKYQNINVI